MTQWAVIILGIAFIIHVVSDANIHSQESKNTIKIVDSIEKLVTLHKLHVSNDSLKEMIKEIQNGND